jgi:hypothetical protein
METQNIKSKGTSQTVQNVSGFPLDKPAPGSADIDANSGTQLPPPIPTRCPPPLPLSPSVAIPGKLIVGTGAAAKPASTFDEALGTFFEAPVSIADKFVGLATFPFARKSKNQDRFSKLRRDLLKESGGIRTWYITTGDLALANQGIIGGAAEASKKKFAEFVVKSQTPLTAQVAAINTNTYHTNELRSNISKTYQTNAIVNTANLKEASDLLIQNSHAQLVTDIIFDTHAGEGYFTFAGPKGEVNPAATWEGQLDTLDQFLDRLQKAGILKPGLRLKIEGCNFAKNASTFEQLQAYCNRYKIEIVATRFFSLGNTIKTENEEMYMSFFPQN